VKLLLDQNLSRKLVAALSATYPESVHVSACGLEETDDESVWEYAQTEDCAIVTKDSDFHQRALLRGPPPKVIWLRIGNCRTSEIEALLRDRASDIEEFGSDPESALLILP
jgi:predicted nuclease of predicted toxin-antitoxin system